MPLLGSNWRRLDELGNACEHQSSSVMGSVAVGTLLLQSGFRVLGKLANTHADKYPKVVRPNSLKPMTRAAWRRAPMDSAWRSS